MQLYAAYCERKVEIRQKEWTINDNAWGHDPKDIKFGHVEGRGGNGRLYAVITGITRLNYAFFSHRQANFRFKHFQLHIPRPLSVAYEKTWSK
jgi:hypothetical protein